jgi:hypothetical protein
VVEIGVKSVCCTHLEEEREEENGIMIFFRSLVDEINSFGMLSGKTVTTV